MTGTTIPVYWNSGTLTFSVSPTDLGPIPPTATNILVVTNLNGQLNVSSAVLPTLVIPNLAGVWYINGRVTSIAQAGSNLTFVNEVGSVSTGSVTSSNQVQATDWGDSQPRRCPIITTNSPGPTARCGRELPLSRPISRGTWFINGQKTTIQQSGATLIFTNEKGSTVTGLFTGSDQIDATGWGNLTATLINGDTQINWGNGTVWVKGPCRRPQHFRELDDQWPGDSGPANGFESGLHQNERRGEVSSGTFIAPNVVTACGGNLPQVSLAANNDIILLGQRHGLDEGCRQSLQRLPERGRSALSRLIFSSLAGT